MKCKIKTACIQESYVGGKKQNCTCIRVPLLDFTFCIISNSSPWLHDAQKPTPIRTDNSFTHTHKHLLWRKYSITLPLLVTRRPQIPVFIDSLIIRYLPFCVPSTSSYARFLVLPVEDISLPACLPVWKRFTTVIYSPVYG